MEKVTSFLLVFLTQLLSTIGTIVVFGFLISLCIKLFCKIFGRGANKFLLATGFIGTPIHELSHAFMCLIFGHKITEIKLYQPNSIDGTLGYVKHSFNSKNLYHKIGNFFIGIAPIICGSAILFLLMAILTPNLYDLILNNLSFSNEFILVNLLNVFATIFNYENFVDYKWWIFITLAVMISSHMRLSLADIKGSLSGLIFIALGFLIVDVILYFLNASLLADLTLKIISYGSMVAGFLILSIIFNLVLVGVALIVALFRKIFKKI